MKIKRVKKVIEDTEPKYFSLRIRKSEREEPGVLEPQES